VVLIHGYLAAPMEVCALAEYLTEHGYAVYAVRLKGHGTSPADLAETPWEAWYESVNRGYAIIKSLTDHIVLGGFSTGGLLALLGAARKGTKVQSVFTINAPLALHNYSARLVSSVMTMNRVLKRFGGAGRWDYVENESENPEVNYLRNPVSGVHELGRLMKSAEDELPRIESPTLLVQGYRDPIVDSVSGQLIFDRIGTSNKELTYFDRDRHGIIYGPGAEEVFDRVLRFVDWTRREQPAPQERSGIEANQG
jgi:esterase/lipase